MGYFADIQATKIYYANTEREQCDCLYCQNYRAAFARQYPDVAELLQRMGVDPSLPLDITEWGEADVRTGARLYEGLYVVKGRLMADGQILQDGAVKIILYRHDTEHPAFQNINTAGMQAPYFLVSVQGVQLPWVLQEWPE